MKTNVFLEFSPFIFISPVWTFSRRFPSSLHRVIYRRQGNWLWAFGEPLEHFPVPKFLGTCFTLAHLAFVEMWRRASMSGNHHRVCVKYSPASRPWGLLGCDVPWGFYRNVWLVSKEEEGMPSVHPAVHTHIQHCMHYFGKKAYSFSFYISKTVQNWNMEANV